MKFVIGAAALAVIQALAAQPASADIGDAPATTRTAPQVEMSPLERERTALHEAVAGTQPPNPADVHVTAVRLQAVFDDPEFPNLTDVERQAANLVYGAALFDLNDHEAARQYLKAATEMPGAELLDWDLRMRNSYALKDYRDAAFATTTIAQRWPDGLTKYRDEAIFTMLREIQKAPDGAPDTAAYLTALQKAAWKPSDPFANTDQLWFVLVRLDTERGDIAGAREAASHLHDPLSIVALRADRRFDRVLRGRDFDVARTQDAFIADLRARVAAAPDKLEGVNALADELNRANRPQDALALLDAALAKLAADPKAFSDTADTLNWTLDDRATSLFYLGRTDEGFAAQMEAASKPQDGAINISQTINLADLYLLHNRPADALAAIAHLDSVDTSAYGLLQLDDARACALVELKMPAGTAAVLARMKTHASDSPYAYFDALLFAGHVDDAAAFVIAQLQDPIARTDMLLHLQDFALKPGATKVDTDLHAAVLALRGRPDVTAAIKRVGRIQSYPTLMPGYD